MPWLQLRCQNFGDDRTTCGAHQRQWQMWNVAGLEGKVCVLQMAKPGRWAAQALQIPDNYVKNGSPMLDIDL